MDVLAAKSWYMSLQGIPLVLDSEVGTIMCCLVHLSLVGLGGTLADCCIAACSRIGSCN